MGEPNRVRDVAWRLLAAGAVGPLVAAAAYLCAFYEQRWHPNYRGAEGYAQHELDDLQKAVEGHRRAAGRLPGSLTELDEVKVDRRFRVRGGRVVDPWGNPYEYRAEGGGFALASLGADGRPGGAGRDADLYPASEGRPPEPPTLRQFTLDLPTEGVQVTCALAGACAAVVCLLPPARRRGRGGFLAVAGATSVGAVLTAVCVSYLHIPTGH